MTTSRLLALLLLVSNGWPVAPAPPFAKDQEVKNLFEEHDRELIGLLNKLMKAKWAYETNITEDNAAAVENMNLEMYTFGRKQWKEHFSKVLYSDLQDKFLSARLVAMRNSEERRRGEIDHKELTATILKMKEIHSTAKICPYDKVYCEVGEMLYLEPGVKDITSKSRNYDELAYTWEAWRNASGRPVRGLYEKYVSLSNALAQVAGFKDRAEMWQYEYESMALRKEMLDLWYDIEPLYHELHKYVRHRLKQHYGDQLDISDGLLPAHLLGNVWAQRWSNIFELVKPFPDIQDVNITQALIDQGYDTFRMFQTSDDFYISLGLANSSVSYGKNAMLQRPKDREVVCHASAWNFWDGKDYRIKMCTEINMENFYVVHHEMGHIQYFIQMKDLHYIFQNAPNLGFHEAIGDTIALSVFTPKHLKTIGLLHKEYPDTYETNINFLMKMALDKVAFMPFGLLVDIWRWDVFSGKVSSDRWNHHWWELRAEIQRLKPPTTRTEDDFDPGAKYHVASDSMYISYFIANLLQFQFHRALCQVSGQYESGGNSDPLHKCDIYRSKAAGLRLRNGMKLGRSVPWMNVLVTIADQRTYSSKPLLEYFSPLYKFLVEENERLEPTEKKVAKSGKRILILLVFFVTLVLLIFGVVVYIVWDRFPGLCYTSPTAVPSPPPTFF